MAQTVKCLPAMWETWVQSLGREDPMEKGVATHSSTVTWRIPWREEPGGLWSMGSQRVGHETGGTLFHNFLFLMDLNSDDYRNLGSYVSMAEPPSA